MLDAVRDIRIEDPGIGCYKLWIMLTVLFGAGFMPGRDSFYALLRQHRLMLPARKTRHTTNSNHRYHKWKNLIKGLTLTSANQLLPKKKGTYYIKVSKLTDKTTGVYELETYKE